eukprot:jgi/Phyca11/129550/e_gw1.85.54.1
MTLKTPTIHGERVYIGAGKCGNEPRFINHSCEPNCEVTEFQSCDGPHVGIFTLYAIPAGDELTVDYNRSSLWFKCLCGKERCTDRQQ